jgi:hypothetical protein
MCMIRNSLLAAAATVVLASSGASAMPMASFKSLESQDMAQQVRLVCSPSGRCYRTGPRYRTVRRYGPSYGYYGAPAYAPSYGYGSGYGYGGYGYRRPGVTFGLGW